MANGLVAVRFSWRRRRRRLRRRLRCWTVERPKSCPTLITTWTTPSATGGTSTWIGIWTCCCRCIKLIILCCTLGYIIPLNQYWVNLTILHVILFLACCVFVYSSAYIKRTAMIILFSCVLILNLFQYLKGPLWSYRIWPSLLFYKQIYLPLFYIDKYILARWQHSPINDDDMRRVEYDNDALGM